MDKETRSASIVKLIIWTLVAIILTGVLAVWSISALNGGAPYGTFSLFGGYVYDDPETYSVGDMEYGEIIDSIDISWINGSVNVVVWNEKYVKINETGALQGDGDKVRTKVMDGKLTVKFMESGLRIFQGTPQKSLTVYIPAKMAENMELLEADLASADISVDGFYQADKYVSDVNAFNFEEIDVDSVSGNVNIDCNSVKSANITNGSGSVKLNGKIESLVLEEISGRVEINGNIGEAEINTVSGAVIFTAVNHLPDALRIESVSGNIKLDLPHIESGFFAHLDSISGRIIWNGGSGREYSYGSAKVGYYFDTVSGNVEITVKKH